jgi:hypothetical protein
MRLWGLSLSLLVVLSIIISSLCAAILAGEHDS